MLHIDIPSTELWDEGRQLFVTSKAQHLQLEHSLVSISKWESKWCKPFVSKIKKTPEETVDYIKCMTLTQNVDPEVYEYLSISNFDKINEYIEAPMTATTIHEISVSNNRRSEEVVTSELIYYWMIALTIPFECQKWHLNRLLMLIRVCNAKNKPPTKQSSRQIMNRNAALNAARRKQLNTKG